MDLERSLPKVREGLELLPLDPAHRAIGTGFAHPRLLTCARVAHELRCSHDHLEVVRAHLPIVFRAEGQSQLPFAILHDTLGWLVTPAAKPCDRVFPASDPQCQSRVLSAIRAALADVDAAAREVAERFVDRDALSLSAVAERLSMKVADVVVVRNFLAFKLRVADRAAVPVALLHHVVARTERTRPAPSVKPPTLAPGLTLPRGEGAGGSERRARCSAGDAALNTRKGARNMASITTTEAALLSTAQVRGGQVTLTGAVVRGDRQPLCEGVLELQPRWVGARLPRAKYGTSDSDGRFHIDGIEPGFFSIAIESNRGGELLGTTEVMVDGRRPITLRLADDATAGIDRKKWCLRTRSERPCGAGRLADGVRAWQAGQGHHRTGASRFGGGS